MNFSVLQARRFAGKTQRELARKMGICVDSYRAIELNPEKATVKQAKIISEVTGIPVDKIFFSS